MFPRDTELIARVHGHFLFSFLNRSQQRRSLNLDPWLMELQNLHCEYFHGSFQSPRFFERRLERS